MTAPSAGSMIDNSAMSQYGKVPLVERTADWSGAISRDTAEVPDCVETLGG